MARITSGKQHGASKLVLGVMTSGNSQTEIIMDEQYDRSTREIHIVDLPPTMEMSCLAKDIDQILSRFGSTVLSKNVEVAEDLRQARTAANCEDRNKVSLFLQKAGEVALELAKKVGADVATQAIKIALGMNIK